MKTFPKNLKINREKNMTKQINKELTLHIEGKKKKLKPKSKRLIGKNPRLSKGNEEL